MNSQYLFLVILAVSVAHHTQSQEHDSRLKRSKRQTNADQMVQNILQWLQGVYTQNSRRIRQGTLREYLPPANTQRPRPFEPGYPPAGAVTPQPPFAVHTNPATGAVTAEGYPSAPAGFEPPAEGAYEGAASAPPEAPPAAAGAPDAPPPTTGGSTIPPGAASTTYLPPSEGAAGPSEQPAQPSLPPQPPSETPQPAAPTQPPGETPAFPSHPSEHTGFPTLPPPGFPTGFPSLPPSTLFPGKPAFPTLPPPTGYPSGRPGGFPTGFPSFPPGGFPTVPPTGYPSDRPGFPTVPPTGYPSDRPGFPTVPPTGYPSDRPGHPTVPPTGYPSDKPGFPTRPPPGASTGFPTQPSTGFPTQPPTGLPAQTTTGFPTQQPPGPSTQPPITGPTQQPTGYPSERPGFPTQPPPGPEGPGPAEGTTQPPQYSTGYPTGRPGLPTGPSVEIAPSEAPTGPPEQPTPGPTDRPEFGTSQPAGFTTQPTQPQPEAESPAAPTGGVGGGATTDGETFTSAPQPPDSNTIPGAKAEAPDEPAPTAPSAEDDSRHPPHIHAIDVQCAKEMMTINIEFNRQFDGVIYSKGYYNMPECRYVKENSGQTKYSFTVSLNSCGTEFINAFDTQGKSYLENILVLQNEPGIQEVWDTVRSVRCLWEGSLKESLSVALSVGMLNQEIVTFSGDTAMAKLDINLGRGPFGQPANGLVKIGEPMTLVVSVSGDSGFDIQVKDCRATDSSGENNVQLTDDNGCVLKPKLFGAFQKTRNTGETGASIIAFAYFNAFKFPDVMDLMIECNIELCKTDCEMCPDPDQKLDPARRRRRRRDVSNDTLADGGVTMGKHLMVVLPEDLHNESIESIMRGEHDDGVCMSTQGFAFSLGIVVSLLATSCTFSVYLWLQKNNKQHFAK